MKQDISVGIDFGTTNCTVGLLREDGGISVEGPMPSLGAWSNGRVHFGPRAVEQVLSGNPAVYPIRDLKLLLGTEQRVHAGQQQLDAVELAAELFRTIADRYFSERVPNTVVIGTPVRMPREHRQAVREAAHRAGYYTVRLVYEPTAALIGRGDLDFLKGMNHVLVVDWGGGTLDIAVVRVKDNLFREVAVAGDIADLGGTCLDAALARRLLTQHADLNEALFRPGEFDRFKSELEVQKIDILEDFEGEAGETRLWRPETINRTFRIEPEVVYSLAREFAQRAVQQIQTMLQRSGISADRISHLLFCGGVSKAGVVREEITLAFPNAVEIPTETPQQLTGRGCARLLARGFQLELAADFAALQSDSSLCILLRRGQRIELNHYRTADFLVTDILASEAFFDFGICQLEDYQQSLLTVAPASFVSMGGMFVRVAQARVHSGHRATDMVRVHAGVDENLVVTVHLESHGGGQSGGSAQEFFSGIPLAVRLGYR